MRLLTALILLLSTVAASAQQLPMDPAVRYGKLKNGLTYYISPNKRAAGKAEFYIVQRVGSILEEENQRGLAHFLEHMAFNGTKNFPEKSLINFLESNGVRFGVDINAYTAFDQTVYSISNVPVQRTGMADSCLLILHDWSGHITLDAQEIDAERKVIHEEWRTKRNVRDRIYDQTLPKLFPDSNRYAYRMPIGLMEVVDNFPHQALRDYYHKWYRPDLQAIIVAGDIDANHIEQQITELWKDIPLRKDAAERIYYPVADNTTPIVAIGTDAELTTGTLRISYKYDPLPADMRLTMQGRREEYIRAIIVAMLSTRIHNQMAQEEVPNGIKVSFFDGDYSLAMTKKAFSATATFGGDNWTQAMNALIYQLKRTMEHGFTTEEFARSQQQIQAWIPSLEAGTGSITSNEALVQRCMAHFLHHQPLLSQAEEAKVYRYILDSVTLADVNARFNQFLYTPNGMAILLQGQERKGNTWPTEAEVMKTYEQAWSQKTTPYKIPELEPALELMPQKPQAGSIVKEKYNKTYGTHELLLDNGAKVILKSTASSREEIRLTAISHGGTSLMPDADYNNINAINALPSLGGLAHLPSKDLGRAMRGGSASYQTNVGTLTESFTGTCRPTDAEQLLQLLHLRFTTMRQDTAAFERWQQRMRQTVSQRIESPMTLFSDTLRETMYKPHPRSRRASLDLADSVDYHRTCQLFMERFANAADFTFIFVGKVDIEALRPLICQYIASLPGNPKQKEQANLAALPSLKRGKHVTHIQIPEAGAATMVIYNILAKKRYSQKNSIACSVLSEVMNTLCTETLREQEGGTYNVSVTSRISRQPADELTLMFNFNTNPEQAEKLLQQAISLLAQVATEGPSPEAFNSALEYLKKRHADYRGSNAYWMETLTEQMRYQSDDMLTNDKALQEVTPKDVQSIARRLIRSPHTAEVILNGAQ
ncbi:MAG: insulinase family protein [Bacteroidaceae bacterium]|nr:insulinase family protein [Bacteroidaceae bacterium]